MTKYLPGDDITFELEHRDTDGVLANADTVTFSYRMNTEEKASATPTNASAGIYRVILAPSKSGVLRGEWTATTGGIDKLKQDQIKIWPSKVQDV